MKNNIETAIFGGGCFWCLEEIFKRVKGVIKVVSGYAGGEKENPTYDEVCSGRTGHAEVIKLEFDNDIISYQELLDIFLHTHDPTSVNRQGNDVGTQYRSLVLYADEGQRAIAEDMIKELNGKNEFSLPIATEVLPLDEFYEAEDYHKDYYEKNPDKAYCRVFISPKLAKLKEKYFEKLIR